MKLSELTQLLTNDVELNKFIAENCPVGVIHSTHPIIEIFSNCEDSENVKDQETLAELILQLFDSKLSSSDMLYITNKFPTLTEKAFKCYVANLTNALRVNLEELVRILAKEPDILDIMRDLIRDIGNDPDSVNNTIVRCLLFKLGLKQLEPNTRLTLLKKTLADEELSRALYTKEPGTIYGQHPVTGDLQKCHGANYAELAQVAEMVVIKYGNELIFTDFEYLCARFPQAREKIFENFVATIGDEEITLHLPAVLQLKKEKELIAFIMLMLNSIGASTRNSYSKNKKLMAAFTVSLKFIDQILAKELFSTYIKPLFLDSKSIYEAGFDLTHMPKYLTLLCQFLPECEVLGIVGASTTMILGTPDGISYYLIAMSGVVPEPFFLQLLDKISQSYGLLEKSEIESPNPTIRKYVNSLAPRYRAKVDEYFLEHYGSSIEDYRQQKRSTAWLKHETTLAGFQFGHGLFVPKKPDAAQAAATATAVVKLSC